jgi:pimeloyl-ACP methyl ester carboxylesterase
VTLEVLSRVSAGPNRGTPLLFVHGAYTGAWCWDEYFLPWFSERGFETHALSLRGHGGSAPNAPTDFISLDDYVADLILIGSRLTRPVLIGHSMGATVVQRAARRCNACGMVLIAPVPPHGLASSVFALASRDPPLFFALNTMQFGNSDDAPALRRIRDYLFSQTVSEGNARKYLLRMQRESQRALADLSWPQYLWIRSSIGIPALVLGASRDAFFSESMVEDTARLHGVTARMFPDMAHAMMLEPQWERVADAIRTWLAEST